MATYDQNVIRIEILGSVSREHMIQSQKMNSSDMSLTSDVHNIPVHVINITTTSI